MADTFRDPRRLLLAFFLLVVPLLAATQVDAQQMVSVAGREVNLRSGPGTQHPAEWIVSRGYPLRVVGSRGAWLQVSDFENDRGWIYRPLTDRTPHHVVKASSANLRSRPTTQSSIVGKLDHGDVLKTLERRTGWVKVQAGHLRGWVAKRLLWGW